MNEWCKTAFMSHKERMHNVLFKSKIHKKKFNKNCVFLEGCFAKFSPNYKGKFCTLYICTYPLKIAVQRRSDVPILSFLHILGLSRFVSMVQAIRQHFPTNLLAITIVLLEIQIAYGFSRKLLIKPK